jgi:uncharacterized membrane protein YfcA
MGISLGLLGSGGSILTLPLLVYIAKEPEKLAIAESLLIVGIVALVGSLSNLRNKNIELRLVFLFGIPSMFAAFAGAHLSQFISAQTQLITFAIVMISASLLMLWPVKGQQASKENTEHVLALSSAGIMVGLLAGLVGVGGGFLIVPALLFIAKTPIKKAVATSLLIIAFQSLSGFSKYAIYYSQSSESFNWSLIFLVTSCALCGVFAGTWVSGKLPQIALKRIFGIALIPLSVFIFTTNI